jgi:WD40 repeat protein
VVVWDACGGDRLDVLDVDAEDGEVSWSPDSRQIAAARKGFAGYRNVPAVLICDMTARKISYEVPAPAGLHGLVTWSPDGLNFASIVGDNLVVFAADTGAPRLRCELGRDSFRSLSWSPDGTVIAVGAGNALTVHAYPSGERAAVTGRGVEHLAFDPTGRRIVCLFSTGELEIWDRGLRQRFAVLREPDPRSARGLHWSEDIVVVTRDGVVLRWRLPPESGPVSEPSGTRPLSAIERLDFGLPAIGVS